MWTPMSLVNWVLAAAKDAAPTGFAPPLPPNLVDLRKKATKEHDYGRRPWSEVTGICLHQTACLLGERLGTEEPWKRWYGIGCHVGITRSGKILWFHDFNRLIVHGNRWNKQTAGVEIDGLYAGVQGDPKTVWDDPDTDKRETGMELPEAQAEAARIAIEWMAATIDYRGGRARALVAHRQSSKNRRNDPGSEIWQRVALPMQSRLQMSDGGEGFKLSEGYPIPREWNPAYKGTPY